MSDIKTITREKPSVKLSNHGWPSSVIRSDGPADAKTNMALDAELFEGLKKEKLPPIMRLYTWSEPCVTIGCAMGSGLHLQGNGVRSSFVTCLREVTNEDLTPLPATRRPTGGGVVIHQPKSEITIALTGYRQRGQPTPFAELRGPAVPQRGVPSQLVNELYRNIHEPIICALRNLGYDAQLFEMTKSILPLPFRTNIAVPRCFDDPPCLYDGIMQGRKILGGSLRLAKQYFLYQGTIKLEGLSQELLAQELRKEKILIKLPSKT
ncbi:MAG: lipoate--protein ligase family protein [Elusimicrobia bacterium]|nr:lipoate--protein ligase family protein [Elusimicrobiota bacterium]